MNAERQQLIEELFDRCAALAPGERETYLQSRCADVSVRREVEALLWHDREASQAFLSGDATQGEGSPAGAAGMGAAADVDDLIDQTIAAATPTLHRGHRPAGDLTGKQVGRYVLLGVLGEGGMGVVYEAEQSYPLRRSVALKIIKPGIGGNQIIARFESERQALAMMDHPNVARILDAGSTDDGQPYFVMELVRGGGVAITRYCDDHRLTIRQRLELFAPVCDAVQHAHQKGIIHRDLKPSNILITGRDGKPIPKVIDFGVAKAMEGRLSGSLGARHTESGLLIGTLEYMSPEQADVSAAAHVGASAAVDTRSDIYSLGAVLYELLCGALPYDPTGAPRAAGLSGLGRIVSGAEPLRPSSRIAKLEGGDALTAAEIARCRSAATAAALARELRREPEWICLKAIRRERDQRYRTASEVADDIGNYLAGRPLMVGPESLAYRVRKFVHRNAAAVALVATGVLMIAAVTVIASVRISHERDQAVAARRLAEEQRRIAERERGIAELRLAESHMAEADAKTEAGRWNDAEGLYRTARGELLALGHDTRAADLGLWELDRRAAPPLASLPCGDEETLVSAISPDGRYALAGGNDRVVRVWDLRLGRLVATLTGGHGQAITDVSFSPDGRQIISVGLYGSVCIWDWNGAGVEGGSGGIAEVSHRTLDCGGRDGVQSAALSPDGRTLATGAPDGSVRLWDPATGEGRRVFEGGKYRFVMHVRFSPDGKRLAAAGHGPAVRVWDLDHPDAPPRELKFKEIGATRVAFSPDSARIAACGYEQVVTVWDARDGRELLRLQEITRHPWGVEFSPDGRRILTGAKDNSLRLWDSQDGSPLRVMRGHGQPLMIFAISPDGRRAVSPSKDHTLRVWDLDADFAIRPLEGTLNKFLGMAAYSPDGRMLLMPCQERTMVLFDTATGRRLREFEVPAKDAVAAGAAWDPDGMRFYTGGWDWTVRRWDVRRSDCEWVLGKHSESCKGVAISHNGQYVVSSDLHGAVWLWDSATGKKLRELAIADRSLASWPVFSPDDRRIAWGKADGRVMVFDLQASGTVAALQAAQVSKTSGVAYVMFSGDGRALAAASPDGVSTPLLDPRDLHVLRRLGPQPGGADSFAFTADSSGLFCGSSDQTYLWNVNDGRLIKSFGEGPYLHHNGLSPDGTLLQLSIKQSGRLLLYDLAAPLRRLELEPRAEAARQRLQPDPHDAAALRDLGLWYAACNVPDWAIDLLERARSGGAEVPPVLLAQLYSRAGQNAEALAGFQRALSNAATSSERLYLGVCVDALRSGPSTRAGR